MLKVLKWEFIKNMKSMKGLYLLAIVPTLVMGVLPVKAVGFMLFSSCLLSVASIFILFRIVINFVRDDLSKTTKLECMTKVNFIQVISSKLLINIVMFEFVTVLLFLGQKFAVKFSTENTSYFELELHESFWIIALLFTFIYPSVVAALYYAITSIPVFRDIKVIVLAIIILIGIFTHYPLDAVDNKLIWYSTLSIIATCALVVVGYIIKPRRS